VPCSSGITSPRDCARAPLSTRELAAGEVPRRGVRSRSSGAGTRSGRRDPEATVVAPARTEAAAAWAGLAAIGGRGPGSRRGRRVGGLAPRAHAPRVRDSGPGAGGVTPQGEHGRRQRVREVLVPPYPKRKRCHVDAGTAERPSFGVQRISSAHSPRSERGCGGPALVPRPRAIASQSNSLQQGSTDDAAGQAAGRPYFARPGAHDRRVLTRGEDHPVVRPHVPNVDAAHRHTDARDREAPSTGWCARARPADHDVHATRVAAEAAVLPPHAVGTAGWRHRMRERGAQRPDRARNGRRARRSTSRRALAETGCAPQTAARSAESGTVVRGTGTG